MNETLTDAQKQGKEVWVRLEGALTDLPDVQSTYAILNPKPTARETLEFAQEFGLVIVYGDACYSPRGQRAVQRWINSHGLGDLVYWVSHETTPPTDAEVIESWPMSTSNATAPAGSESATKPPTPTATGG